MQKQPTRRATFDDGQAPCSKAEARDATRVANEIYLILPMPECGYTYVKLTKRQATQMLTDSLLHFAWTRDANGVADSLLFFQPAGVDYAQMQPPRRSG